MAPVTFSDIGKVYPDGTCAVSHLDLEVQDGEFMVFVGPSGCGKTTALRMVAGLEAITSGEISIAGEVINAIDPRRRNIAMVFQSYALYPNMTVFQNMAFGLKMQRVAKKRIEERVKEIAGILELSDLLHRKPSALSGGQRQRVAMGRAIVRDPSVFLMDEPLSNLDAKLRAQMRSEIARIQAELATTTIYVTHDQTEAMTMGTRVAVIRKGVLQQVATPREIYDSPVNLFVASFLGSPPMNLIVGTLEQDHRGEWRLRLGSQFIEVPAEVVERRPGLSARAGASIGVGIRPESLALAPASHSEGVSLAGRVAASEILGPETLVYVDVDAPALVTTEVKEVAADVDAAALEDAVRSSQRAAQVVARLAGGKTVGRGDAVRLEVDVQALHFFDIETERSFPERGTPARIEARAF